MRNPSKNIVTYDYPAIDPANGNVILLDRSYFACLGIREVHDSLIYLYHREGQPGAEFCLFPLGRRFRGIFDQKELEGLGKLPRVAPLLSITDARFRGSINIDPAKYYDVDSTITRNHWIDVCVPIRFISDSSQKVEPPE